MAHKKHRPYVLWTLRRYFDAKTMKFTEYKWYPEPLTRGKLIEKLATSEMYSKEYSILNTLSAHMAEASAFVSTDYVNLHYIEKQERDGSYTKVEKEELESDVLGRIEQIKERRAARLRRIHGNQAQYTYRYDPVPHVHRYSFGGYYRHPHIHRILVASGNPEHKPFIHGDERQHNLPKWDDCARHTDKCWKTSFKCRKQWMKHKKTKGKYIVKEMPPVLDGECLDMESDE